MCICNKTARTSWVWAPNPVYWRVGFGSGSRSSEFGSKIHLKVLFITFVSVFLSACLNKVFIIIFFKFVKLKFQQIICINQDIRLDPDPCKPLLLGFSIRRITNGLYFRRGFVILSSFIHTTTKSFWTKQKQFILAILILQLR